MIGWYYYCCCCCFIHHHYIPNYFFCFFKRQQNRDGNVGSFFFSHFSPTNLMGLMMQKSMEWFINIDINSHCNIVVVVVVTL
jgi:hypothetical protein